MEQNLDELGARLYEMMDAALPSFAFTMNSAGRWVSKVHTDGESSTDEASIVYENNPMWIQDFARGAKSVIWAVVDIEHRAETYTEAVAYLCRLAGMDAPQLTDEQLAKILYTRRLTEAQKAYHTALMTDPSKEAQAVRDYLIRRGWSYRDVEHSGLGFASEATRALLFAEEEAAGETHAMHYVGTTYTLAIPVWAGGNVCTFKFRNVFLADKKKRYRGLEGVKHPVLGGIPLRGQTDAVIVVEGEMDALHDLSIWRQIGEDEKRPNHLPVVATGMGAVTPKMAEDAVRRGVTYFILALDQDDLKEAHTSASARNIHAAGGVALVMDYPQGVNGKGPKDLDEMYCDLVDAEDGKKRPRYSVYDAQRLAATAIPYAAWLAQRRIAPPAQEGKDIEGIDSYRVRREISRAIQETPAEERPLVIRYINDLVSEGLDAQGLADETAAQTANKARVAAYRRAADLLSKGDHIGAQKVLKRLEALKDGAEEDRYKRPSSDEEIYQEFAQIEANKGISMGWDFGGLDLNLPAAGISVFGLPTSHGKTTILENVCIKALHQMEKPVWYIHYEEPQATLTQNLIKIEANYPRKLNAEILRREPQPSRLGKARDYIFEARKAGRLFLLADTPTVEQLYVMISKAAETDGIGCLIIDYIQLIRCEARANGQKETMAQVCRQLIELARQTNIPIITASQLNRNPLGPLDLSLYDIADASDIAHAADLIVIGWNTGKKPEKGARGFSEGQPTREAMALEDSGAKFDYDAASTTLYLELFKARGRKAGSSAIIPFDMATGKIG